jgi:hypothetical protein
MVIANANICGTGLATHYERYCLHWIKGLKFIAFIAWNNHSGSPYGQSDSQLLQFGYQSVFFENLIAAI